MSYIGSLPLKIISLHTSIRQCVLFGKIFNGESEMFNTNPPSASPPAGDILPLWS
ncbi:hypothetical protein KsCSTR_17650 [Candidatus Kuenenia stuttgartiensis]|uniref:Uncharacterized protein n=1 Tax=Kuenenia stuttgartiensis TaxID=174633 RepID=Q1Q268_KUEST|nr:hypothetical protein KsCSTR_17650 [Candidatus Kuenenia stuttgartiensis]CAJ74114.1 unknown protein [Candidatus Kuenenia stuttgartiensis]